MRQAVATQVVSKIAIVTGNGCIISIVPHKGGFLSCHLVFTAVKPRPHHFLRFALGAATTVTPVGSDLG